MRSLALALLGIVVVIARPLPARADFPAGWSAYQAGDHAAAAAAWLPRAAAGDLDAMYNVAALYENGKGVDRDLHRAVNWYRDAAQRGFAPAQFRLAQLYHSGLGVKADPEKALKWYRRAAGQGYPEAQYNIGVAHEMGTLVPPDGGRAAHWYELAAEQGLPTAQYNLGRLHFEGKVVPRNIALAVEWYRRAAKAGFAPAQNNLAYMYENGLHVRENVEEAARWYRAAATKGDAQAQVQLALLLANGQGIPRDPVEAYAWLGLAGEGGDQSADTANEHRERLTEQLGPEQKSAAERRTATLRGELAAVKPPPARPAVPRESGEFGQPEITVQRRLSTIGLYKGAVDGLVGPGTVSAIRAFQRKAGLKADGKISPKLIEALDAAAPAQ